MTGAEQLIDRKEERQSLAMNAKFKGQQDRRDVLVTDLSRHGCRIFGQSLWLLAEQRVILRPQGLESLLGTVRWSLESEAGIEFESPLHPAIVDHLCRLNPEQNAVVAVDLAA